uniref:Uncharacterized protein n=1 Tax=Anopheles minimus TaxID=112268 RepID=A0A182VY20_9DIPT
MTPGNENCYSGWRPRGEHGSTLKPNPALQTRLMGSGPGSSVQLAGAHQCSVCKVRALVDACNLHVTVHKLKGGKIKENINLYREAGEQKKE